jgi:hypothetical protein
MAAAVPAHRALRSGPFEPLVGPFLCPASRVGELQEQLHDDDHLRLGLIVDTGIETVPAATAEVDGDSRLVLAMVEVPVPPGTDVRAGADRAIALAPTTARLFVELPRTDGWRDALDTIAAAGRGAKLRTGGLRPELFPSDAELAAFIEACAERVVAFKCTAGLHHAVRHTDPATSFHHHGFLNILVATCRAIAGGSVQDAIAERDPAGLAAEARSVDDEVATVARHLFVSYGSCSINDPVDDLRTLGLLPTSF